jgi:hypothetical protein
VTIVTSHYRYKRQPKKRKAVALQVPATVTPAPMKQRPRGPVIRLGPKGEAAVNDNGDQPRLSSPRRTRTVVMAGSATCPI